MRQVRFARDGLLGYIAILNILSFKSITSASMSLPAHVAPVVFALLLLLHFSIDQLLKGIVDRRAAQGLYETTLSALLKNR